MSKGKVISTKNLPSRLPIWSSITAALALDYWKAPEWLIGAVGLFFLLGWVLIIISRLKEEEIDLFEMPKPKEKKQETSTFQERLKQKQEENKNK
tara:strand:+ start:345 stop:629 length:285 start_codon:yes stop_codon:yes gene_type:complete